MLYRVLVEFRGETVYRITRCGRLGTEIRNDIVTTKCYYFVVTGVANGVLRIVIVVVGSNSRSSVRKLVNGGGGGGRKNIVPIDDDRILIL